MNLGEYFKRCREASKRTQPDVAGEVGIEQSYMSKLESGKSIPSNDVFNSLVRVYGIKIDDLIAQLDEAEIARLGELTEITKVLSQTKSQRSDSAKQYSLAGLALLVMGIGLLCFSILPIYSDPEHYYRSEGVLALNEDLTAFDLVYTEVDKDDTALLAKQAELLARLDQQDVITDVYKGDGYVVNTSEGRRYFTSIGSNGATRDFWNRWLLVPAFMLIVAGFGSLLLARRWSKLEQ